MAEGDPLARFGRLTALRGRNALVGDTIALLGGTLVNGLTAYLYVILGTRALGAAAFAPVSILWTALTIGVAVLGFPLQHWVVRTVRSSGAGTVRAALPAVAAGAGAVAAGMGAGAWLLRHSIFGDPRPLYPLLLGLVVLGCAATGMTRGGLAAGHRFTATGVAIGTENLLRLVAGAAVLVVAPSADLYAAALLAGTAVVLLWPSALRFGSDGTASRRPTVATGLVASSLAAQTVLNVGPVAVALLGGAPSQVTSVFAALALLRAPYLLLLGLSTRLTSTLTTRYVRRDLSALRRWERLVAGATAALVVASAVLAPIVCPPLLDLLFGGQVQLSGGVLAALAGGSVAALGALVETLLLVAAGRTVASALVWAGVIAAATPALAFVPLEPVAAVATVFGLAEVSAFAGQSLLLRRVLRG